MRILLLGKGGQLGSELTRCLRQGTSLYEITAVDYPEIDLSKPDSIRETIREIKPELIINATAYTAVDKAESQQELANAINGTAPGVLAEEASALHAILIHYSTDYVFDGIKGTAYVEADSTNPLNVYGSSKLRGEKAIQQVGGNYLILRTAWVYSYAATNEASFVRKVLQWARQNETLHIVDDQVSNPTWARALAEITAEMLRPGDNRIRENPGLYHLAGDGYASRMEWARQILKLDPSPREQVVKKLVPAATSDFPTPAKRPLFSALDCDHFYSTFGLRLPSWTEALEKAMREV